MSFPGGGGAPYGWQFQCHIDLQYWAGSQEDHGWRPFTGQRCQTLPLVDAGGYCHVDFGLAVPRSMWRLWFYFWSFRNWATSVMVSRCSLWQTLGFHMFSHQGFGIWCSTGCGKSQTAAPEVWWLGWIVTINIWTCRPLGTESVGYFWLRIDDIAKCHNNARRCYLWGTSSILHDF